MKTERILAIESSCDETAVALVDVSISDEGVFTSSVISSNVLSQIDTHRAYGGVIPEVASREHYEALSGLVKNCIQSASVELNTISRVAATVSPGLVGGLLVGSVYAKNYAFGLGVPFSGINHIEGHVLTVGLTDERQPPYLVLLVSGGHCQFVSVKGIGEYELIGKTVDDSVGECFDKVAQMLNLPYPGGPEIEKLAMNGNPEAYELPKPMLHNGLDFSFSGLKTAVRQLIDSVDMTEEVKTDICASFQQTVADLFAHKLKKALKETGHNACVVAGGVAANKTIRAALDTVCQNNEAKFIAPPLKLCTDNAEMIAYTAGVRALLGAEDSEAAVKPRWPLEDMNWRYA
ncbi:MAG: tRNA (adenosine(37)-N6)-threonylcarbamoyltransferase complex transferase subunit TsaD [Pseudomonadota bacterium]|nr:tRNA (adenosine(37)-N6)-threonylcarbamoyltransferase complex transferase subunit TsaD [Pseudomonadota bacterium]